MLSNEKIKWMTRAALYEKKEEKRNLRINRFHQNDYISWNVMKSLIVTTAGYAIGAGLYLLYGAETMLDEITFPYLLELGGRLILVYAAVLAAAGFLAFLAYYARYQRARKKNKTYVHYLKKINRIYQKESRDSEGEKEELP